MLSCWFWIVYILEICHRSHEGQISHRHSVSQGIEPRNIGGIKSQASIDHELSMGLGLTQALCVFILARVSASGGLMVLTRPQISQLLEWSVWDPISRHDDHDICKRCCAVEI